MYRASRYLAPDAREKVNDAVYSETNARQCRLKFIEFRLAVKRGEGKRGFKGSRNTYTPCLPSR